MRMASQSLTSSDLPLDRLEATPRRPAMILLAFAMTGVVAAADYLTGYEVRLNLLYVLPVALATWAGGLGAGILLCVTATLAWGLTFRVPHAYSGQWVFYWEGALNIVTLLLFAVLLARLQRALARSDERFVTAMQSLDAAVYATNAGGDRIVFANQRFLDTFPDAARSRDAASLHDRFAADLGRDEGGRTAEVIDRASDRWYLSHARDIRWIDGTPARLHVLTEVTDAHHARDLRRRHEETLHRTSRVVALSEMASSLGHELNQPLGAIGSYLEACERLLLSERPDLAELREVIGKCRAQAIRAGTILRRMREFVSRREPVRQEMDLNGTVADVVRLVAGEARARDIAIRTDLDPAADAAPFDRLLVEQALVNLLRNAFEALEGAAPERRWIDVRTRALANGEMRLSVEDHGEGIAPEVAERLFVSFVTTKPGGTGLGLSICRSIVEAHGGRLWHETLAGGICAFHFTLPGNAR